MSGRRSLGMRVLWSLQGLDSNAYPNGLSRLIASTRRSSLTSV